MIDLYGRTKKSKTLPQIDQFVAKIWILVQQFKSTFSFVEIFRT